MDEDRIVKIICSDCGAQRIPENMTKSRFKPLCLAILACERRKRENTK